MRPDIEEYFNFRVPIYNLTGFRPEGLRIWHKYAETPGPRVVFFSDEKFNYVTPACDPGTIDGSLHYEKLDRRENTSVDTRDARTRDALVRWAAYKLILPHETYAPTWRRAYPGAFSWILNVSTDGVLFSSAETKRGRPPTAMRRVITPDLSKLRMKAIEFEDDEITPELIDAAALAICVHRVVKTARDM